VPDVWHLGEWSLEMLELRDTVRQEIHELTNSMVANQYLDRRACIDHHSDKTPDIKPGTSIRTTSSVPPVPFSCANLMARVYTGGPTDARQLVSDC
jgi:hypothetical protein